MGTEMVGSARPTLFERMDGWPGRLGANKAIAGVAAAGVGGGLAAGAAAKNPAIREGLKVATQKVLVPAAGATLAIYGAAMAHDAFVRDKGNDPATATGKVLLGSVMALGGTEIVGRSYNLPVLRRALSGVAKGIFSNDHWVEILAGGGLAVAGASSGIWAYRRFRQAARGEDKSSNIAKGALGTVGAGAALTGAAALLGGSFGNLGVQSTIRTLATKVLSAGGWMPVVGAGLLAGGAISIHAAAGNPDRQTATNLNTLGVASAAGGVVAMTAFAYRNPVVGGAMLAAGAAGAGYMFLRRSSSKASSDKGA